MPTIFSLKEIQHNYFGRLGLCVVFLAVFGCSLTSGSAPNFSDETDASAEFTKGPEPVYNAPGKYSFHDKCLYSLDMTMEGGGPSDPVPEFRMAKLWVCVTQVLVDPDLTMRFEVEYSLAPTEPEKGYVERASDQDNRNIFLTDDQGGRYEFEAAGGCAAEEIRAEREEFRCMGWFLFPPAKAGVKSFDFHYATAETVESTGDNKIPGIELIDPET
jgi:hypothetical protein